MRKISIFILAIFVLWSCDKDDSYSSIEKNVVYEDNPVPFEELLLLINIKSTDSTYLVVKSVDSISIILNNQYWAMANSQTLDTTTVDKMTNGNRYETNQKVNYLVLATQDLSKPGYTTAGEYSQFLNESLELRPGEYACFIKSFMVTFNDNTTQKYYPLEYKTFSIAEDTRSAFVGEFEIPISH